MAEARNSRGQGYEWNGGEYAAFVEKMMERNLDAASLVAVRDIKGTMKGSGISGTRSGATRTARASAARGRYGKPPRVQTGTLKRRVSFSKRGRLKRAVGVAIGSNGGPFRENGRGYAYILEFLSSRKGWRPFLRPYFGANRDKIQKIISKPLPPVRLKGNRR